ncbi:MAG: SIS domain-containing protein [Chitinophagales bacterium]|jgi:D-sedoheptulose 7-phosphate isomerase
MFSNNLIQDRIQLSISVKQALLADVSLIDRISSFSKLLEETYRSGGKVLFCGNGGSAGDAQHLAAELSGRFYLNRAPLYAEALHVNSSYVTAVANDFGYEEVYARMVEACGRPGDVLVAISTSGNSPNIIRAIDRAKQLGMVVVGMTGATGGKMADLCDLLVNIPSEDTPRIQESHILVGHIICELVEKSLFSQPELP